MNQETKNKVDDVVLLFCMACSVIAIALSVCAIVRSKRELRDAEREAAAAHAARVIFEGGQSSCK